MRGLSAADFTVSEDGHPQKVAFFGAERQPISLTVLLDSGRSMDFGNKLGRAREMLAPLLGPHSTEDEIYLVPFTDQLGPFEQLHPEQQASEKSASWSNLGHRGSALYDALASALCHMQTAKNVRKAIVVLTDGLDQHSRLRLEQITALVKASNPQVFMIGFFSQPEYRIYKSERQKITIVGLREIDNPVVVFNRLAKESGAKAFFPSSPRELAQVLEQIHGLLQTQYSLAYYTRSPAGDRGLEVSASQNGLKVTLLHASGQRSQTGPVHFTASGCEVSPEQHRYPWEARVNFDADGRMTYHEDFSTPASGWPDGSYDWHSGAKAHYTSAGYEVYRSKLPVTFASATDGDLVDAAGTEFAAYGPWWTNFRATALMQGHVDDSASGVGLAFNVNETGYYALLLNVHGRKVRFELVRGKWGGSQSAIVPWTSVSVPRVSDKGHKLSVQCTGSQILLSVDDQVVRKVYDNAPRYGLIGLGVSGPGKATFRDLLVQELP